MNEWKEYKLGDIAEIVMGQSPTGDTCNNQGIGTPLLNGPTEFSTFHPIPTQFTTDPKRYSEIGDILFCVRGSTTGKMNWSDVIYAIGRGIGAIRHRQELKCNHFIKAIIQFNLPILLQSATGSTFPNISREQLNGLRILAPDLPTQTAIAEILSSLDDKIELNNKINQELEALAQTLFKRWFVDFEFPNENGEPYKSSGGQMVDSELGEIPKDWDVKELGKVSKLSAGGDKPQIISEKKTNELKISVYSNGITNEGLFGYTNIAKINEESVTISARGTIGFVNLRTNPYVPIVRLISASADKSFITTKYLYMWLKNMDIVGNGTTQQQLTVPDFKLTKILIPVKSIVSDFTIQIDVIIDKIELNKKETLELTQLRDTLLPKLISGELEVS